MWCRKWGYLPNLNENTIKLTLTFLKICRSEKTLFSTLCFLVIFHKIYFFHRFAFVLKKFEHLYIKCSRFLANTTILYLLKTPETFGFLSNCLSVFDYFVGLAGEGLHVSERLLLSLPLRSGFALFVTFFTRIVFWHTTVSIVVSNKEPPPL